MLDEMRRADQTKFLARPEGEHDGTLEQRWIAGLLPGQTARQRQYRRRAGGIVICPKMNLVLLAGSQHRAALAVPEMIVMRPDDDELRSGARRRQHRNHVSVRLADVLDLGRDGNGHV